MIDTQRDSAGFDARRDQYIEWCKIKGRSEETLERAIRQLIQFSIWCEERGILRPVEVTLPIMERYQRHLFYYISPRSGNPLAIGTQLTHLTILRSFFHWLARQHLILYNPAADLELPRLGHRLPKHILSVEEAHRVLTQPDIQKPIGFRDRALLELIFATGLRRSEVRKLKIDDVDVERKVIRICQAKGRKDRYVPVGDRALRWMDAYVRDARPHLVVSPDEGYLFLSKRGRQMSHDDVSIRVRHHVINSGIGKGGSTHLFRHTCATLMLEGGADTRYVQEMLGHSSLEATKLYTHVAITKLKEVYRLTHPAAKDDAPPDSAIASPPIL